MNRNKKRFYQLRISTKTIRTKAIKRRNKVTPESGEEIQPGYRQLSRVTGGRRRV
jgi:hypothetical protein